MKTAVVAFAIVALAALLAACVAAEQARGPTYKVEHLFKPPASEEGQRCVAGCDKNRVRCETAAQEGGVDRRRACEQQAADEHELCVGRTTSTSEKNACYRKSCPVGRDYVNCEASFRSCFEGCGGQVWSRTVCEANC